MKLGKKWVLIIVAMLLALLVLGRGCSGTVEEEEAWPNGELASLIPVAGDKCISTHEYDDELTIHFYGDKDAFAEYAKSCESLGYSIDKESTSTHYYAYNNDGYRIEVTYYDSTKKPDIYVSLDRPKTDKELEWPEHGPATLLPNPDKKHGSIAVDSSNQFTAYVGDMTTAEFRAYVKECTRAGFTKDYSYSNDKKLYDAKDSNGNSLRLEYQGFKTMYISLYANTEVEQDFDTPKKVANTSEETAEDEALTSEISSEDKDNVQEASDSEQASNSSKDKTQTKASKYELAYVIRGSEYYTYMLIDTDKKTVLHYTTNDTSILKGKYKGNFNDGATVTWSAGGDIWKEKMHWKYWNQNATMILVERGGGEVKFTKCDMNIAVDAKSGYHIMK